MRGYGSQSHGCLYFTVFAALSAQKPCKIRCPMRGHGGTYHGCLYFTVFAALSAQKPL